MRKNTGWASDLLSRLRQAAAARKVSLEVRLMVQVELGLTLLRWLCPTASAWYLWGLLGGYPLPIPERAGWSAAQKQALAACRFWLTGGRGRRNWERMLRRYQKAPIEFRMYDIDKATGVVSLLPVAIAADRLQVYEATLARTPAHTARPRPVAGPGVYGFHTRRGMAEVRIPTLPAMPEPKTWTLTGKTERSPIIVRLADLQAVAVEMDRATGGRYAYTEVLSRLKLEEPQAFEQLVAVDQITLDGIYNLVGMLGAGKSTLMDLLAVWLARNGLHVTLLLGDTAAVLERVALFRQCGITAAPLLGETQREHQLRKFAGSLPVDAGAPLDVAHDSWRWLSTFCPLDGLRQDEAPLRPGDEPCQSLLGVSDEGKLGEDPATCPYWSVCPAQERYHALPASSIWVGTPQSLIYTRIPGPLMPERLRMIEAVYRRSDLVIVDEADRVQSQLDMAFVPEETLIAERGGWLGELQNRVKAHRRYLNRGAMEDPDVADWVRALSNADSAANRIYEMLQQWPGLRQWLGNQFFTASSLFRRVLLSVMVDPANAEVERDEEANGSELLEAFRTFADDPLGGQYTEHHPDILTWIEAARLLVTSDQAAVEAILGPWLAEKAESGKVQPDVDMAEAARQVQLAVAVAVLDHEVAELLGKWQVGVEAFALDANGQGSFMPAPAEHSLVIPEAPMGNLLGFQYLTPPGAQGPGLLRFFRSLGLGRWLLLHFPTLYYDLDGTVGPHLLLLSGSSWAPKNVDRWDEAGAPGYHIQLPVNGVLTAPPAYMQSLRATRFFFAPQRFRGEPIHISGQPLAGREGELARLVAQIALPQTGLLDRALAGLPAERQAVLLLVGSYVEAAQVSQQLQRLRSDLADRVVQLVPDDDKLALTEADLVLPRGQVKRFAATGGQILVAPVLAVERGHNILNQAGQAALGAALFLVRPMPVPGDLAGPVHSVMAWAVRHMSDPWLTPGAGGPDVLGGMALTFRKAAARHWHDWVGFRHFRLWPDAAKEELFWTQLIIHWQVIGRLLRGGVPATVYFCDAAYMPHTAAHSGRETKASSVLVGYQSVLTAIEGHPIAQRLYGPLLQALAEQEVLPW